MGLPRGTTIRLSPFRKMICDMMHFSQKLPLVAIERRIDFSDLIAARQAMEHRPSWFAILTKAYGLVALESPPLRQAYLTFPWARIHQHACNVAHVIINRKVGDEDVVMPLQMRYPETQSIAKIDAFIRSARTEPVESFSDFRRYMLISRFPQWLRRMVWWAGLLTCGHWRAKYAGTFGVTGVAALGATSLTVLSPLTTTFSFGAFDDDGTGLVRLFFDHRVVDGAEPARALEAFDRALHGPILEELRSQRAVRLAA